MSTFFLLVVLLVAVFMFAEGRPTLDELGTILRKRTMEEIFSNDPQLLARLEQIMNNDFSNDGRLFNLQRLG